MSLHDAPTQSRMSISSRNTPDTSLHGNFLILMRVLWVVVVVLVLVLCLAIIPSYFASLHHILNTTDPPDFGGQLTTSTDLRDLPYLSLDFYAWYNVFLYILFLFVCTAIGLVIFWRRSDDRMALLASLTLVLFLITVNPVNEPFSPVVELLVQSVRLLGQMCLGLFFYLFPSGKFVPGWVRWLAVVMIAYWIGDIFFPSSQFSTSLLSFVVFLALGVSQVIVQVYRYRHVSNALQRQQTKWVVFGMAVALGGTLIEIVVFFVLLPLFFHLGALAYMIGYAIMIGLLLLFPLSIGIAMLRSRLWDIDILINRTLVYTSLTGILIFIYFSCVIALQYLLRGVIGQTNNIAIVGSTLAIAALFQPLRGHIQNTIDRRFYRHKYDAAQTLAAFSAVLRNEVDLNQLSKQLVSVVEQTLQPSHVSLWLRKPERDVKGE